MFTETSTFQIRKCNCTLESYWDLSFGMRQYYQVTG